MVVVLDVVAAVWITPLCVRELRELCGARSGGDGDEEEVVALAQPVGDDGASPLLE